MDSKIRGHIDQPTYFPCVEVHPPSPPPAALLVREGRREGEGWGGADEEAGAEEREV